jgi:hypothetical protein
LSQPKSAPPDKSRISGLQFAFLTPRALPKPEALTGRVVVLDIAFAAEGGGSSFEGITLPFIQGLGSRLAAWVDHHDHERHAEYAGDPRFVLATKAQHGACPEMVTPEIVAAAGPVDTVAVHMDLDGLYAGAKWALGGVEPYPGADADARAVDTRRGEPGPIAVRIDRALRARFRDAQLKHQIIQYLVARTKAPSLWEEIEAAARLVDPLLDEAKRQAERYRVEGQMAYVRPSGHHPYDKTELLLLGQQKAPVAVVHDSGSLSIAADFESGLDFVKMFELGGGMPTRVSIPESRLAEVREKLARVLAPQAGKPGEPGT